MRETYWFSVLAVVAACGGSHADDPPAPDGEPNAEPSDATVRVDAAMHASNDAGSHPSVLDAGSDCACDASAVPTEDASTHDAGVADAGPPPHVEDAGCCSATNACTVKPESAHCTSQPIQMVGAASDQRRVYWALPTTPAPAGGYPAVILYQGSYFGPATTWNVDVPLSTGFGGYYQVALIAALLEQGFVVVQPEAQNGVFWSTNTTANYDSSVDAVFIPRLLDAVHAGTFGAVDETKLYATGISSGGYMTSRMAVSYAGRFRALAIESGSYATCAGPLCNVPSKLPSDHPPTLFLHGDADNIVPISTAKDYDQKLKANGIETKFVENATAGHEWLSTAPQDVPAWFLSH